jgi:hypothetical protein
MSFVCEIYFTQIIVLIFVEVLEKSELEKNLVCSHFTNKNTGLENLWKDYWYIQVFLTSKALLWITTY